MRRACLPRLGQRLLISAVRHSKRSQYRALHHFREGLSQEVRQCHLHYDDAAARILVALIWRPREFYRSDIRWFFTIQNLHERRQWRARRISGKAKPIVGARRVTEKRSRRDRLLPCKLAFR